LRCEDKINEMSKSKPKCPICRQCIENYEEEEEEEEEEDDDESDDE
jgi:L-lysine 2,3-aminomutase